MKLSTLFATNADTHDRGWYIHMYSCFVRFRRVEILITTANIIRYTGKTRLIFCVLNTTIYKVHEAFKTFEMKVMNFTNVSKHLN